MEREQILARLAELETAIHQLRIELAAQNGAPELHGSGAAEPGTPEGPWYITGAGRFANDPEFEEMCRLGREYRESLRPGPDESDDDPA